MKVLRKLNSYHLTALGEGWGWGSRCIEIVGQTIGLLVFQPLVAIHNATGWLLEKFVGE